VEDNVLGGHTGGELAIDLNAHVLASASQEGLGREDVLDFTGSNAESQGAKGTVGGGVAVTANNGCSGQSEALLGADNVDNTLTLIAHTEVGETKVLDILLESCALEAGVALLDEFGGVLEVFPGAGGNVL
jgi:hypothetical protein